MRESTNRNEDIYVSKIFYFYDFKIDFLLFDLWIYFCFVFRVLHWNQGLKFWLDMLFCGVFFSLVKQVKNPQFDFSSQNLCIKNVIFSNEMEKIWHKWIWHVFFHTILKNNTIACKNCIGKNALKISDGLGFEFWKWSSVNNGM